MNNDNLYQISVLSIIIIVSIFIGTYVPFLTLFTLIIVSGLTCLLSIKYGSKISIFVVILNLIILILFSDWFIAVLFTLLYFLVSHIFAYCLKNEFDSSFNILVLIGANIISLCLFLIIISNFIYTKGLYNLVNDLVLYYKNSFNNSINLYQNINQNNLEQIKAVVNNLKPEFILSIIPGSIVVTSMIISIFTYKFTEFQFKKNNLTIKKLKPFIEWHVNDIFAAITIGLVSIGIILKGKGSILGIYILNSAIISGTFLFTVLGISIISYFFKSIFKISNVTLIFIIVMTVITGFSSVFLFLGISDSIINFRKLKYKNKS